MYSGGEQGGEPCILKEFKTGSVYASLFLLQSFHTSSSVSVGFSVLGGSVGLGVGGGVGGLVGEGPGGPGPPPPPLLVGDDATGCPPGDPGPPPPPLLVGDDSIDSPPGGPGPPPLLPLLLLVDSIGSPPPVLVGDPGLPLLPPPLVGVGTLLFVVGLPGGFPAVGMEGDDAPPPVPPVGDGTVGDPPVLLPVLPPSLEDSTMVVGINIGATDGFETVGRSADIGATDGIEMVGRTAVTGATAGFGIVGTTAVVVGLAGTAETV